MTDSMKCPICGKDLIEIEFGRRWFLACDNSKCRCKGVASYVVWQALIDGKKAQDALKGIEIRVATIRGCVQDGYTQLGERNRNIFIALELFKDLIKEITSITK